MSSENNASGKGGKIMLVGFDNKQLLERRFRAAGCYVVKARDNESAFDHVRHEVFDTTVLVSRGSLINVAETVFNLRDFNPSMEIIVLVERLGKHTNRFLRQLLEHPIEGTEILTRRRLQKRLHAAGQPAPPGESA
jgi:DNA-binding response OmpR family regulator